MDGEPTSPRPSEPSPKRPVYTGKTAQFFRKPNKNPAVKSTHQRSNSEEEFSSRSLEGEPQHRQREWQEGSDIRNERASGSARVCKCVAGASVDCAAICCCPFTVLHLLALLLLKLPATAVHKLIADLRKKYRKRKRFKSGSGIEEPAKPTLSECNSYQESIKSSKQSSVHLQDQEFLRDYFECNNLGFGRFELNNSI
ncbi:hypothetical protein O6H91_06G137300 [Diphasiastrum complanatum]|nr:hypothetical protein O6H91_06G137300 [Diphasiastrum complanatum]